ncbi:MAG: hypothetical protein HONBIEJF_02393 [Fimbriimonadaceae bacterium]|nr:hypothetical protein [Fimbriimonadaceae bacterium]
MVRWIVGVIVAVAAGWAIVGFLPATTMANEPTPKISILRVLAKPVVESGRAKHEPAKGCYLGAYVELDPSISQKLMVDGRGRRDPAAFEKIVQKPHASYFFYLGYGRPLPSEYIAALRDRGKLIQIALEPNAGLATVQDDDYLRSLADMMRDSKARIFLRFASEMNGDWVRYHGDPVLYRQKWRLVHRVMAERAPNVAMVWCPYAMPLGTIDPYYPGDAYVDWVGVNMYNVTYFNQNKSTPAHDIGPFDLLDPIYRKFADRKPIMIAEYGVTHFSAVENKYVRQFAVSNLDQLYQGLRKRYPKVKAIYYFNTNGIALKHRRNNDYRVTTDPTVRATYRKLIDHPYFLSGAPGGLPGENEFVVRTLDSGSTVDSPIAVRAEVSGTGLALRYKWGYVELIAEPDGHVVLDPRALEPSTGALTIEAVDADGNVVAARQVELTLTRPN